MPRYIQKKNNNLHTYCETFNIEIQLNIIMIFFSCMQFTLFIIKTNTEKKTEYLKQQQKTDNHYESS